MKQLMVSPSLSFYVPLFRFLSPFPFGLHPSPIAALWLSPCKAQPCHFPLPLQCPVFQVSAPSCSLESLPLMKAPLPLVWFIQVQVEKQVEHSFVKLRLLRAQAYLTSDMCSGAQILLKVKWFGRGNLAVQRETFLLPILQSSRLCEVKPWKKRGEGGDFLDPFQNSLSLGVGVSPGIR